MKSRVRETLTLHGIVVGPHAIVADVETELYALADWPDFPTGPLGRGETRRSQNFIWYDVAEDRFTRIRSAHHRRLQADDVVADMAMTSDPPMPLEQLTDHVAAFNRGDHSAYGDFDADVVLDIAGKRVLRGRDAIFDFYREVGRERGVRSRSWMRLPMAIGWRRNCSPGSGAGRLAGFHGGRHEEGRPHLHQHHHLL